MCDYVYVYICMVVCVLCGYIELSLYIITHMYVYIYIMHISHIYIYTHN